VECPKITTAEVQALIGKPVKEPTSRGEGGGYGTVCEYKSVNPAVFAGFFIHVFTGPGAGDTAYEGFTSAFKGTAVSGIGKRASFTGNILAVQTSDRLYEFQSLEKVDEGKIIALAHKVVG
jgi:hypothetical protein